MPKNRLKITAQESGDSIVFQLNPTSVELVQSIAYNHDRPLGALASVSRYSRYMPQKMKFSAFMDSTGAIDSGSDESESITDRIESLNAIIYDYSGDNHQPNIVEIQWGNELFVGRLQDMSRKFTLYDSEGDPLRAELQFIFVGYVSAETQETMADNQSPDLTHIVRVRAGDNLPALCFRIYKNVQYYPMIAQVNKLTNVMQLKPGIQLVFPPIKKR
ncbi:CIS tube protein [Spartinivicinus poritis]|uniref:Contractile injection system tube protein N-terminal domain-containing protein n=1 Tax=Spartinivicinus poritis TaxID=2994640 RepID=A0ABT5U2S7_9GAMM|nr:hypothetical protein [Spartinivicinus sp. A2-2]MDE1460669.1 hypothetical protein [Spartinivicinus sp. A2-2]